MPTSLYKGSRLLLKDTVANALPRIASNARKEGGKTFYDLNEKSSRVLLRSASRVDPWEMLVRLDRHSIYGDQIYALYSNYCNKDLDWFIACVMTSDPAALEWLSKTNKERERIAHPEHLTDYM
jgi:hypothetical protein